jgi:hypothetical protein
MNSLLRIDNARGVMSVLDFHFSVFADVNDLLDSAFSIHFGFDCDVHVEGLIGLFLTVLDAKFFTCVLCDEGLRVDAVKMALSE